MTIDNTGEDMSTHESGFKGVIGRTFRDSKPWWPDEIEAPKAAPNVLFVVLDDVGFADLGCYGSEIATPNINRLADGGLRYTNFHVTSLCSPTRACLLTGRNAHAAGMGIIAEWSGGFPGYQGRISRSAATIAEVLVDHGFGTYAIGKWHLTNISDYGAAGPYDQWPLGRGFGRWYGFHGALMDQWNPELYQDNRPIDFVPSHSYHLSADLVERAIGDIRDHVTSAPEKPFFVYLAFGACHWPHQVPRAYIDRYRGRYDIGWDQVRAARLERQIALGVVPADTPLAPRNPGVQAWAGLSTGERRLSVRLQEAYAGFLEHTDSEVGKLLAFLATIGRLDDTLIVLLSDNGASAEGGATGAINMRKRMAYGPDAPEEALIRLEEIGGERAYNHYSTGWAQVSNTPLKWYKKNTHGGGIRAPLVMHWPRRILRRGNRDQFHHVIDIAPTLYELLNIEAPTQYRGTAQTPIHGTSMLYTWDGADERTRKDAQYFEVLGDRAIWHRGWKAVAHHTKGDDFEVDQWELYQLENDFNEIKDLATAEPERLRKLVELWWAEAGRYDVLPLDDRDLERTAARLRMNRSRRYVYLPGMARVDRLCAPDITDRSYRLHAEFESVKGDTQGVIISWGSRFAGFTLYIMGGLLCYEYVRSEAIHYAITAPLSLSPGARTQVELSFWRTGKNAGHVTMSLNGAAVGHVDIPATWPTYHTTAGINCGTDAGAPVVDSYSRPFSFSGRGLFVILELGAPDLPDGPGAFQSAVLEQ